MSVLTIANPAKEQTLLHKPFGINGNTANKSSAYTLSPA
jgi:hypothetical protein